MNQKSPQPQQATGHPDANHPQAAAAKPTARKGSSSLWVLALLLVLLGAVVWYSMNQSSSPPVASASHEVESEPGEEARTEEAPEAAAGAAAAKPNAVPPRPATELATLRVEANVPRAKVSVDGRERGTTPLEIADLAPGRHEFQFSAEGYETRTETLTLKGGRSDLKIDLTSVAAAAVKHKHRIGSCEGVLRASAGRLEYDTSHKDAFSVALSDVEELSFDKETLSLKVRGGRNYNFDERNDDPAALSSFHQRVAPSLEKSR